MKKRLLLLAIALAALNTNVLGQEDLALQAQNYYESGNYAAASAVYEGLIASGIQDSAIFINLGHSYFEQHDFGRALLNYRRAQLLTPRDAELTADLARVRSLRSDIQGDETALIDSLALLSSAAVTDAELGWVVLSLWIFVCGTLCLHVVKRDWRGAMRGPLLIAGLMLVLGLILWGSRAYTSRFRPAAVVIVPSVSIMSGPGEAYLELYSLHTAAELRVLQTHGGWARLILPDQRQGWIPLSAIESV